MSDIAFNKPGAIIALKRGVAAYIMEAGLAWLMALVGLAAIFSVGQITIPQFGIMMLIGIVIGVIAYGYIIEWAYENINGHTKLRRGNLDVSKKGVIVAAKRGVVAMVIAAILSMVWLYFTGVTFGNPIFDAFGRTVDYGNWLYLVSILVNLVIAGYIVEFTYENIG